MTAYFEIEDALQILDRYGIHIRDIGLLAAALARPAATVLGGSPKLHVHPCRQAEHLGTSCYLGAGEGGGCLSGQGGVHRVHSRSRVIPWRIGDIGVRRAIAHAWTLNEAPTIDEVRERGQGWALGRSYATA